MKVDLFSFGLILTFDIVVVVRLVPLLARRVQLENLSEIHGTQQLCPVSSICDTLRALWHLRIMQQIAFGHRHMQ